MKMTIRSGIFETNSSMTHSLVIGTKEDFQKWEAEELVWDIIKDQFITKEKAKQLIDDKKAYKSEFKSYESIGEYFECDSGTYTSPNGDEICWIAEFGYDG